MNKLNSNYRRDIAKRIKELRKKRGITQKELADYLGLSQNRISQLEAGQGSFSAEHLLLLSKKFNVPTTSFVVEKDNGTTTLQNALVRLGAHHLSENEDTLPSEDLIAVLRVIQEVLASPKSPRHVTALAPILAKYTEPALLNQIRFQLYQAGFIQRYGWLLENVRDAIKRELEDPLPHNHEIKYKRAQFIINNILNSPWFNSLDKENIFGEDILDPDIISEKTLSSLRAVSSNVSKKWKIISRIQLEDFVHALRESRETN